MLLSQCGPNPGRLVFVFEACARALVCEKISASAAEGIEAVGFVRPEPPCFHLAQEPFCHFSRGLAIVKLHQTFLFETLLQAAVIRDLPRQSQLNEDEVRAGVS